MTDNSLLEDFADETREHLEELESSLLRLETDPADRELLNTIFRSMHTIKGASEYLGFERIARLTHRLENLLDLFRDGSLRADKVAVDLLIDARDRIGDLIAQVEDSGQESAEIDDLLERVDAVASGPAPAGGEAASATVYDGEADTELFDIFMEQLAAGIGQLMETAVRMARGEAVVEAVGELTDQVDRLAATANYMGYDALSAVYDDMLAVLEAFASRTETAGADDIDALLQSAVVSGVNRIQDLFPHARSLKTIDTRIAVEIPDGEPASHENNDLRLDEENHPDGALTEAMEADAHLSLEMENDLDLEPEEALPGRPILQEADNSLLEDFADETREHLEELESSLLRLETDPADRELLNTIFRSMHTIKGASEYLGFERIARLTHRLENLLDLFRDGSLRADKVAVDLLIDARDRIGDLIAQVEDSGQESAEIDDLLERVDAVASGPAPAGGEAASATVYDGEADTELFDIFMEQLAAGIGQLMETAVRMARGEAVVEAVGELTDQVDRLAATANYMGYDALSAVYDDMLAVLEAFASRTETAEADDIDALLQSAVVSGVNRIQDLFPHAESIAAIDLTVLAAAPAGCVPADQMSEPGSSPSSDIADLLAGLPAIAEDERESLLSKTLDETFSSMRNCDADDSGDAQTDGDPIAMQFSSEADGADFKLSSSEMKGDRDEALAILDDFGVDRNDAGESPVWLPAGSEGEGDGDLWPEATTISMPEPQMPVIDPETPARVIDFSTPTAPQPTTADEPEPEVFSARSTIRKSIRVDADKVDDLMNQVGELVVNRSSFAQLFSEMRELTHYLNHRFPMDKADQRLVSGFSARLNDATAVLGRVSSELQEQVMKVRMLPISRLFNRYPRLVHDLLRESDKKIQLQFRGEETELDRMVIEQLADPMIHIIRNAVDHGIESRDDRKRKGKPESGVLLLEAYHEGSNVIIEVTDDGKGIDLSRIRQKAVEKQLADRETLERMDQQALIDMIMLPGFSTTDQVTHTSGRGVGMDVVKRNIEKINGTLIVDTRQDVGTRIRIKIPLTLAIIPALMIQCGGSHITVPLSAVQETFRLDRGEIFTVDGSEMMHLHDEPLSLVRLTDLLNMPAQTPAKSDGRFFVVVVKAANGRIGFIVDKLLGRQEVVIKPLEDYLQENSGFSGATILGDGSISLILNVDELVVMAKDRESERRLAAAVL
ncbi:Hpt domain-containing protein [uncultured Desulfosarcina sp.]|uniref:chemotaxis protein CheA n=1 Tax=uncultured Desulfosarcina sp. TaxID=218289 RepID=UPI0029C71F7A|nr:Hpt domain-containing protein [uncultured Desulfosarcina sp.]